MPLLRHLLLRAARHIASDPRVQARAAEFLRSDVRPRAEAAWQRAKPKLEAAQAELRAVSREVDPRREPGKFAVKLKERLLDRRKPDNHKP